MGPTNIKLGLKIHINDHYELLNTKDKCLGGNEIINVLKKEWDSLQRKAVDIDDKFFKELP